MSSEEFVDEIDDGYAEIIKQLYSQLKKMADRYGDLCYYADPDWPQTNITFVGRNSPKIELGEIDFIESGLKDRLELKGVDVYRVARPDDASPQSYLNERKEWRKDPPRGIQIMREGIHFILGALFVSFLGLAILNGLAAFGITIFVSLVVGFFIYEVVEGWRIRDNAFRDIAGFLGGTFLSAAIWVWPLQDKLW